MELTIGKLKEILNHPELSDNMIIMDEQNQTFVHTFANDIFRLSTTKPIGYCNRTGSYVYPSIVEGYQGFCPELDEDLYSFEFTPIK